MRTTAPDRAAGDSAVRFLGRWDPGTWVAWAALAVAAVPGALIVVSVESATTDEISIAAGSVAVLLVGVAMAVVGGVSLWSLLRGHRWSVLPLALAALMTLACVFLALVGFWAEVADIH